MESPVSLHTVTTEALGNADLKPQDRAAAVLALEYARTIDNDPDALDALGPKLLAVLTALGMTPSGRGVKGGAKDGALGVVNPLDELHARRVARAG